MYRHHQLPWFQWPALPFLGPMGIEFRTNLHRFKSEVKTEPLNLLPAGEGEDATFPLRLSSEEVHLQGLP